MSSSPAARSTTLSWWPVGVRPKKIIRVATTDDWLAAIAAERAVGVTG